MAACSKDCRRSKTFTQLRNVNMVTVPFDESVYKEDTACIVCDKKATLMCARCHVTAYCTRKCGLDDYNRHKRECKLHCPRLVLFQNFQRCQAPPVSIKHTGIRGMGVGMFARKEFLPGHRIIEDVVQFNKETDLFPHNIMKYVDLVNENDAHILHTKQFLSMTDGCIGFWTLFINHCCLPNCVIELSECKKFILLTAIRKIIPGEQLSVAYFRAVYTPKRIRGPIIEKILGTPCVCASCLFTQPYTEQACEELWLVMQHYYGVKKYKVLEIRRRKIDVDLVLGVVNRIIDIAHMILGCNLRASDPWLVYIYHAMIIYLESIYKKCHSKSISDYLAILKQDFAVSSENLGFCSNTTVRIIIQ